MQVEFTENDQHVIEELKTMLPSMPLNQIKDFFIAYQTYVAMAYSSKEQVYIPLFGEFKFNYEGDEETKDGKEAKVTGFFYPHKELRRMIGQIEDAKKSGDPSDLLKISLVQTYTENILVQALSDKQE